MEQHTERGPEKARSLVAGAVRAEWSELGRLGRSTLVAAVVSGVVAVVLAVSIPRLAERYLIEGERDSLQRAIGDLVAAGLIDTGPDRLDAVALNEAIQLRLSGREVERVKIWARDGEVIYSDAGSLVGNTYPVSESVVAAFHGEAQAGRPHLDQPDNVGEIGLGELLEYYIPVLDPTGEAVAVYEVYERAAPLLHTVGKIRGYVFVSVGIGIGLLAVLLGVLVFRHGVRIMGRRRQAEQLLGDLIRSQDLERTRIVGALHDDIGQPLYRIHFGIEDCRARVEPGSEVESELAHIGRLTREVDARLRSELRLLTTGTGADLDMATGLRDLTEITEQEAGLSVELVLDGDLSLPPVNRAVLLRAAQEAVINVRKHAYATQVEITAARRGDTLVLDVADDGVGIVRHPGLGIVTTKERLEAIGGGLRIRQRRGGGTLFRAWVPTLGWEQAK
jgi:signal transduction histidine kinase